MVSITYDQTFIIPENELAPIMNILTEAAPITTRTDIDIWASQKRTDYVFDNSVIDSTYGGQAFYNGGRFSDKEFDGIRIKNLEPTGLAHELTHAYTARAYKEARGYAKLTKKIQESPELKEKLEPIAQDLKEKRKDVKRISREDYGITEAIAHACESEFGQLTEHAHRSAMVMDRYDSCKELIGMIGIDGARSFVRNKLREGYLTNEFKTTLREDVNTYREGVISFYKQMMGDL